MREIDLSYANLSLSIFEGVDFTAASVDRANLSCASLMEVDISGAIMSDNTLILEGVILRKRQTFEFVNYFDKT